MLKTSTVAACMLALTGGVAMAQMVPPGPDAAPRSQMQYGTQPQYQYQAQGRGMGGMTSGDSDNPRAVAITDEYGNKYNSRGDRIGHGRPMRMQQ